MKAAVVSSFDTAPRYEEFSVPTAAGDDNMVIDVIAAGLHPRVRSQADGSHYTSTDELPLVPGIDGIGRGADGLMRYFILPDTTMGAMAEQTVIDTRRSIVLPEDSDPIAVAAAMNPAMCCWVALRQRVQFQAGQNVLVLGATGTARTRPGDHERNLRHRCAAHATHQSGTSLGRRRPHDTAHRSHPSPRHALRVPNSYPRPRPGRRAE